MNAKKEELNVGNGDDDMVEPDIKWAARFASNDGNDGTNGEKCAQIMGQSKRAAKSRMEANSANRIATIGSEEKDKDEEATESDSLKYAIMARWRTRVNSRHSRGGAMVSASTAQ